MNSRWGRGGFEPYTLNPIRSQGGAKMMNSPVEGGGDGGAMRKTARELHEELWCADPNASVFR